MVCGCEGPGVEQVEGDIPVVISWIQISKAAGTNFVCSICWLKNTQHVIFCARCETFQFSLPPEIYLSQMKVKPDFSLVQDEPSVR